MSSTDQTNIEIVTEKASDLLTLAQIAIPGLSEPFLYEVPRELEQIQIGYEVEIPLRNRKARGWVTLLVRGEENLKLRSAIPEFKKIIAARESFHEEQLTLFQWIAEYYGTSVAEVIETAVPKLPKREAKIALPGDLIITPPKMTAAQASAVESISQTIDSYEFRPFLLFGITGSGKTEVYLQVAQKVLNRGGKALIVVPEIALTPQLVDRFAGRLKAKFGVLHSQLTAGERGSYWLKILRGEIDVVLGARSAIFAPFAKLDLIIVDEEHDGSYKQSDNLRYHARDVAIMRGKFSSCPVVLGSATPSFESLLNVKRGNYKLLEMPERATPRQLPPIEIVNLNSIKRREMASQSFSPSLRDAMEETLKRNEQTILLYNRRGFASYLQCETCSEVVLCPNCSLTLTYHKRKHQLLCHYCGLSQSKPTFCRYCRDPKMTRVEEDEEHGKLEERGSGTERIVEEISELFPQARVVRMDRDSVTSRDSYKEILDAMRLHQADILIGTQMIAKGHDLPGVTLVGIIDADVGLHAPDFRSSERSFQLITQAAGRAGRGDEAGRVIIQTREPTHPTILAATQNRFRAFARFELEQRKQLQYPPWSRLMRLVISSTDPLEATRGADDVATFTKTWTRADDTPAVTYTILGPALAPHERLRGRYRHHLLIKCNSAKALSRLAGAVTKWKYDVKGYRDLRVGVDVDPVDML